MRHNLFNKRPALVMLALVIAALACSAPSAQTTVETPSAAVADAFTNTPFVITATPDPAAATVTPAPSGGTTGGTTGGATGGTTGGGATCGYDSLYIADLTIPDGTELTKGTAFTKTWRVQNNGCAEWPGGTSLVFVSGDPMGGPSSIPVPQTAAGGTQDISLNLTAPNAAGDYTGKWQLRTPDGIQFGDQISVKIKSVNPPPPAPGATATPTFMFLLPVTFTAPTPTFMLLVPLVPLLTMDYTATYAGAKPCFIGTGYMVKIKNTGGLTIKSGYTKFEVPPGTVQGDASSNEPFMPNNNCSDGTSLTEVPAGNTVYMIGGASFTSFPSGTAAKITLKLCGLDDMGGVCATKVVTFNIP